MGFTVWGNVGWQAPFTVKLGPEGLARGESTRCPILRVSSVLAGQHHHHHHTSEGSCAAAGRSTLRAFWLVAYKSEPRGPAGQPLSRSLVLAAGGWASACGTLDLLQLA